jgi:hypothetical protein
MNLSSNYTRHTARALALAGVVAFIGACASMAAPMYSQTVTLVGASEVPPVTTTATGTGTVTISPDRMVVAKITITGMTAMAAHIHEGAEGKNGPVIVPFTMTSPNVFEAPAGAMLTEAQYASFKAGNLYVNAHSKEHPGGEIRAQLKPM